MPDEMEDQTTITVKLGEVFVFDTMTGKGRTEPGWEISGANWMVTRRDLPGDFPLKARVACELLRAFGEFTPQQARIAQAALEAI